MPTIHYPFIIRICPVDLLERVGTIVEVGVWQRQGLARMQPDTAAGIPLESLPQL